MRDVTNITDSYLVGNVEYDFMVNVQESVYKHDERVFISMYTNHTGISGAVIRESAHAHLSLENAEQVALAILAELRDQGYGDYGNL